MSDLDEITFSLDSLLTSWENNPDILDEQLYLYFDELDKLLDKKITMIEFFNHTKLDKHLDS